MYDKNQYTVLFLDSVNKMINSIPEIDRAKVAVAMLAIKEGNFQAIETKILKTPIRELKVKVYRFVFFIDKQIIYFIHAFIKQSTKKLKKEINYAEKIYKKLIKI